MSTNYHTPWPFEGELTAANLNSIFGALDEGITEIVSGASAIAIDQLQAETALTISGGAITVTQTRHNVDTQGASGSDDLDTINGGTDGMLIELRAANSARTVVVKHNTGNIYNFSGSDVSLGENTQVVSYRYSGTLSAWLQVATPQSTQMDPVVFNPYSEVTIAAGAITCTQTMHRVDTQSDAGTDDLDTINYAAGNMLLLRAESSTRTVVLKHGTGNIYSGDEQDHSLDNLAKVALLVKIDGSNWQLVGLVEASGGGGGGGVSVAQIQDQKSAGTNGGTSSATTWNPRDLNTEVSDPDNIVTISSNKFTPIAGTYVIAAKAPVIRSRATRLRLYNVTQTSVVSQGPNNYSEDAGAVTGVYAELDCVFTANGTDEYRIDQYTETGAANNGLGRKMNIGSPEVYLQIILQKVD